MNYDLYINAPTEDVSIEESIKRFNRIVDAEMESIRKRNKELEYTLKINDVREKIDNPLKYRKVILLQGNEEDSIDLSELINVESVSIFQNYTGEMPILDYSKVRELSITSDRNWKDFADYSFDELEILRVAVPADDQPLCLKAKKLKDLTIHLHSENPVKEYKLDLSWAPCIKTVSIHGNGSIETITIIGIEGVKTLNLQNCGGLYDFEWISKARGLDDLMICGTIIYSLAGIQELSQLSRLILSHDSLKNVEEIASLPALSILDLSVNEIEDVSSLYSLDGLKLIDLSRNPGMETGEDRITAKKKIVYGRDEDVARCIQYTCNKIKMLCERIVAMDARAVSILERGAEENTLSRYLLKNYERPVDERAREMFQRVFLDDICSITPWSLVSPDDYYTIKDQYIYEMLELYPFLLVDLDTKLQIEREKRKFCDSERNSLICLCDKNIFSIRVTVKPGKGKCRMLNDSGRNQDLLEKRISELNWKTIYGFGHHDYEITVEKKYVKYAGKNAQYEDYDMNKMLYPIAIAMVLSERKKLPEKTMVIADYRADGKIIQKKLRRGDLVAAKYEGAEKVVVCGKKNTYKDIDLDDFDMEYMFAKSAEDIVDLFLEREDEK